MKMKAKFSLVILFAMVSSLLMAQKPANGSKPAKEKTVKVKTYTDPHADSVYQARVKMVKIDGVYIPRDLFDVFRTLDTLMDDEVRVKFKAFSEEEVDPRTHASLGKWLEEKWGLKEGSRLSAYYNKMGLPHYDYMVGFTIISYHRYLHKRDLKSKELVEKFKEMWKVRREREKAAQKKQSGG